MKKLLLPFLALLFLISCEEKVSSNELIIEDQIYEDVSATTRSSNERDVCHNGNIININVNAIPGHQGHGDAVDMDEDGYFDIDNPCSETDCDDTVYDPENSCCEGYEIDFEGPLFVALANEVGVYTWQGAIDACAAKAEADGCAWYLPNKEELNALYLARNEIGGFEQSGFYWSSTEFSVNRAWIQNFSDGYQFGFSKFVNFLSVSSRCVRR